MLPLLGRSPCHMEEGPVLLKDRERQEGSGATGRKLETKEAKGRRATGNPRLSVASSVTLS